MKPSKSAGSIFERDHILWTYWYHPQGGRVRKSTKLRFEGDLNAPRDTWSKADKENFARAEKHLAQAMLRAKPEDLIPVRVRHLKVEQMWDRLELRYKTRKQKSFAWAEARWRRHLKPYFGNLRAAAVDCDKLDQYIVHRQQEGAEDASINRELAVLRLMFRLALKAKKLSSIPVFPERLDERKAVRQGFVELSQYNALKDACGKVGLWLRAMFEIGFTFGWRKNELLKMRCRQVNLAQRVLSLDAEQTKSGDPRHVPMTSDIFKLLQLCTAGKKPQDYVFTRGDGQRVKDFRGTWAAVVTEAGMPGLLFHDLRRSAVRNLVRSGTSETVAMSFSGHKTRDVFDRYNITAERDQRQAIENLEQARKGITATIQPQSGNLGVAAEVERVQ